MAFAKGELINASDYRAYQTSHVTSSLTHKWSAAWMESLNKSNTGLFYTKSSRAPASSMYNVHFDVSIPQDTYAEWTYRVYEGSTIVFDFSAENSSPSTNTYGWAYTKSVADLYIFIPASETQWKWYIRWQKEPSGARDERYHINLKQGQNDMLAFDQVRALTADFSDFATRGTTELTYALGQSGRVGTDTEEEYYLSDIDENFMSDDGLVFSLED